MHKLDRFQEWVDLSLLWFSQVFSYAIRLRRRQGSLLSSFAFWGQTYHFSDDWMSPAVGYVLILTFSHLQVWPRSLDCERRQRNWLRFMLNHLFVWLALFTTTIGSHKSCSKIFKTQGGRGGFLPAQTYYLFLYIFYSYYPWYQGTIWYQFSYPACIGGEAGAHKKPKKAQKSQIHSGRAKLEQQIFSQKKGWDC